MAILVSDLRKLSEQTTPIPGAKPPVSALLYRDEPGHPEEADEFRKLIREIRRQTSPKAQ